MGRRFFNQNFAFFSFNVFFGTVSIRHLFEKTEDNTVLWHPFGFWEWQPQCKRTLQDCCLMPPDNLQQDLSGGWRWQIEPNKKHILLTSDTPHSKNVIGGITGVNLNQIEHGPYQMGWWILNAGGHEERGDWQFTNSYLENL